jgi:putative transposase
MSDGSMAAVDTAAVAKNGPGQPADGVDAELELLTL